MLKQNDRFDLVEWSSLGKILIRQGSIDDKQLSKAVEEQRRRRLIGKSCQLGKVLLELGLVTTSQIDEALSEQEMHRRPAQSKDSSAALELVQAAFTRTFAATKDMRTSTRGVMQMKINHHEG